MPLTIRTRKQYLLRKKKKEKDARLWCQTHWRHVAIATWQVVRQGFQATGVLPQFSSDEEDDDDNPEGDNTEEKEEEEEDDLPEVNHTDIHTLTHTLTHTH